jgi:hypothetical protein
VPCAALTCVSCAVILCKFQTFLRDLATIGNSARLLQSGETVVLLLARVLCFRYGQFSCSVLLADVAWPDSPGHTITPQGMRDRHHLLTLWVAAMVFHLRRCRNCHAV